MTYVPPPKMTNGQAYAGHKLFLGNGVRKSCGKCGEHKSQTEMRKFRMYGLCCAKCRGAA